MRQRCRYSLLTTDDHRRHAIELHKCPRVLFIGSALRLVNRADSAYSDGRHHVAERSVWPADWKRHAKLQKLAAAASVPEFSLHDLRATGSTWLANEGVPERIRQYLMGHADGEAVIRRYTKVTADTEKEIRESVALFDEIRSKRMRRT